MPEEVLFESESVQARHEIAAYLQELAEKLEDGGSVSLRSGDQSIDVDVPGEATFEIKVEDEDGERSLEVEIEWHDGAPERSGGDLAIDS